MLVRFVVNFSWCVLVVQNLLEESDASSCFQLTTSTVVATVLRAVWHLLMKVFFNMLLHILDLASYPYIRTLVVVVAIGINIHEKHTNLAKCWKSCWPDHHMIITHLSSDWEVLWAHCKSICSNMTKHVLFSGVLLDFQTYCIMLRSCISVDCTRRLLQDSHAFIIQFSWFLWFNIAYNYYS